MVASNAVLLPYIFPSDLVILGQLVRNPLAPNIDPCRAGCSLVKEEDISNTEAEQPYEATVRVDVRGHFEIGLVRLLGAFLSGNKTDVLSIEAEKRQYHFLKDTRDVFRRLSSLAEVQEWINDMVLYKTPCYMVVGLEVVHHARFSRLVQKRGAAGGYVRVPTEATQMLPMDMKGGVSAGGLGWSSGKKVSGVLGIQVQRLDTTIREAGGLALGRDVSWKWSYQRVKGNQQDSHEKELSISLADVEMDELKSIMATEDVDSEQDTDGEE